MRKINIDIELCYDVSGFDGGQFPWHFERVINTLIAASRLEKLILSVRMSYLEALDPRKGKPANPFLFPELWPGWRKLPWAASAIAVDTTKPDRSAVRLEVYVPENRNAEKWL